MDEDRDYRDSPLRASVNNSHVFPGDMFRTQPCGVWWVIRSPLRNVTVRWVLSGNKQQTKRKGRYET
jgi:hypothetical protein